MNFIFMDKALFHCDCITSTRNLCLWSHEVQRNFQHRFLVNVWCGILGSHLCGPHFIEVCLKVVSYKQYIENELLHLENVPLQTKL
jgi:hypothetical protein